MAKYKESHEYIAYFGLQWIANELAEANRLKRLELNLIQNINKQSLEDKA